MFALAKEDTLSDNTLSTLPAIKKAINIPKKLDNSITVSYTHLTLPTKA